MCGWAVVENRLSPPLHFWETGTLPSFDFLAHQAILATWPSVALSTGAGGPPHLLTAPTSAHDGARHKCGARRLSITRQVMARRVWGGCDSSSLQQERRRRL